MSQIDLSVVRETLRALPLIIREADDAALRRRPARGEWSGLEVLSHLVDNEIVSAARFRVVLSRPDPHLAYFDQEVCTPRFAFDDPEAALTTWIPLREANLRVYESITEDEFKRRAVHEERGEITLRDMLAGRGAHDLEHLEQLRSALGP